MKTWSVRPQWRPIGYRCKANNWREALRQAIVAWNRDDRLYRYDFSTGTTLEQHPWGVRLEREQQTVDVVKIK